MANKVQCTGGHWFDVSKFRFCPYCGLPAAVAVQAPVQPAPPVMPPMQPVPPMHQTPPIMPQQNGYYQQPQGVYPVPAPAAPPVPPPPPPVPAKAMTPPAGWLVGVGGPVKGKTYVVRENRNFVGCSPDMDVVLPDDGMISFGRQAVIVYDPRQRAFYAQPGDSHELCYVNDQVVLGTVPLNSGDVIEIGSSKLSLLPLCGEQFGWDEVEKP